MALILGAFKIRSHKVFFILVVTLVDFYSSACHDFESVVSKLDPDVSAII